MKDAVNLKITSCANCPHMKSERHYTADSFEMEFDWKCALANMLHITYHEWNDKDVPIPKWCPLREKEDDEIHTAT